MAECRRVYGESAAGTGSGGKESHGPGEKGTKRGLAVESHGLPIGIAVGGADTHDIKLLEETLRAIVAARPEGAEGCMDAGYAGAQKLVEQMGYKAHVRRRWEEREEKGHNPQFVARRRVVEACHPWMKRFRKPLARCEKKAENYRALAEFACAVIVWRNLIPVYPGLIPG